MATNDCKSKVFLDLSEVVRVLCAVGFSIRHIDATEQKDVTPTGTAGQEQRGGCRVVVTCTTSGLRAVLETVGEECGCSIQHHAVAADVKKADTLIVPFSESAALMLRELLIRLTMQDNEHEKTVSTHTADSSESTNTCNGLQELKLESELQEQFGLDCRSTISVSSDNLSTSSDLGHSLRKGKEISSCPTSPEVRGNNYLGMLQFPSMETLASSKTSGTTCSTPSSEVRREDIEKKLKLAAACIQEVLAIHRRDSTATPKNASLFKVPNVPVSKKKATTNFLQAESPKFVIEKPIKPRPSTPLPVKKAKSLVSDKSPVLRMPNPSSTKRTNLGIVRR